MSTVCAALAPPTGAATVVRELRLRLGALAAALVSRDGQVVCAEMPPGAYAETFGIMSATLLGAATTLGAELGKVGADRVVVQGPDSRAVVLKVDASTLLVAVIDAAAEVQDAVTEMERSARVLRTP